MLLQRFNSAGQSLIEILLAIALAAVLLPALLTGMVAAREGKAQEANRLQAIHLMRETEEAVRSIKRSSWSAVATPGTYHPVVSGSSWQLAAGTEDIGIFTRKVELAQVYRDVSGQIVASGTLDPATVQAVTTVSWDEPWPQSQTSSQYLTRYRNNSAIVQTTQADFDAGTFEQTRSTNTGGGMVELRPGSGSLSYVEEYSLGSNYSFDNSKIEVLNGFAQLKSTGGTVNGSTVNSDFTSNITNWTYDKFGNNVSQTGARQASGGNPGGFAQLTFPSTKNKVAGGYYYQPFTVSATNASSTLTFQWRVTGYQGSPDSVRAYVLVETSSGAPALGSAAWTSPVISGTTGWSGTVTVNTSALTATPGTYYLKFAAEVDYHNKTNYGPFRIGFDNIQLNWSGSNASFPTDQPHITTTNSFTPSSVSSWDSFSEVTETNGGSIEYQLSYDDGATWYYHAGGAPSNWQLATVTTQRNDASTINQKMSGFPTTNGKIKVRAFLISNGSQLVRLDQVTIGYTGDSGNNNGTFTSASFDAGSVVVFNRLNWTESSPAGTQTSFQLATNSDNTTWSYVGPDGTNSSFFTGGEASIPLSFVQGRYLRYKIFFTSPSNSLPNVADVTVNYSP